jgi:flagellar M-ring protein FliF
VNKQMQSIMTMLAGLGARRIFAMLTAVIIIFAALGIGALYLNRPAFEVLYVGLDRDDVNRIGIALSDAGIAFDVDSNGTSVLVEAGQTSRSRMILAEKGLPASSGAGYELFDNLGSLGLTSFMQEVTRVRALEGEIARSIQAINGIKAARVHIVMGDRGGFRDRDRKPTASVLIRTSELEIGRTAGAIRHLVAAAIPGLASEDVTVMDDSGQLLAAGVDPASGAISGALDIQRIVEEEIKQNIIQAIAAPLGSSNYRVSVRADLDTDKRQVEETIFDPESRVERSVQMIKSKDSATQKSSSEVTSVEQNLPDKPAAATEAGPQSSEQNDRQEETTNYEINSKRISTSSNGYQVKRLSVSIVLNRKKIEEILGGSPQQAEVDQRVADISKMATTAAGFDEKRGDSVNVVAVEFSEEAVGDGAGAQSLTDRLLAYAGTAINAGAFIIVSALVLFLGFRPLVSAIKEIPAPRIEPVLDDASVARIRLAGDGERAMAPQAARSSDPSAILMPPPAATLATLGPTPKERIEAMADLDEERTAQVLRRWIMEEAA